MKKIKGREIQLRYLVKSAVAQRYYQKRKLEYETEAARKKFNQDYIDLDLLREVMQEVSAEEIEAVSQKQDEENGDS